MFGKTPYNKETELQFRIAASKNDTTTLIRLKNMVNINSSGTDSKQTAVHRAAAGGHVEALQLLFNLGADFNCCNKDGRKAYDLAATDEVKKLFVLIGEGYEAMAVRKSFFIKTDNECSIEEKSAHEKNWDALNEKIQQKSKYEIAITESYKTEARQKTLSPEEKRHFLIFSEKHHTCMLILKSMATKLTIIDNAIESPLKICSCGEAAAISFVWLSLFKNVDFPVEELNLVSKYSMAIGHALLILNRDQNVSIADCSGWQNALIVDPYYNRIFFFNFVTQYHQDTCIKVVDKFNLVLGARNITAAFPTEILLPETIALYHKNYSELRDDIRMAAINYFPPIAERKAPDSTEEPRASCSL